jgi:hypothetical protein
MCFYLGDVPDVVIQEAAVEFANRKVQDSTVQDTPQSHTVRYSAARGPHAVGPIGSVKSSEVDQW